MLGLCVVGRAGAHTQEPTRRVLVQITPTATQLVIHWTLPDGVEAEQLRQRLDGDGDRRLRRPAERLGQGLLLLPRVQQGLSLWVDGRPVAVTAKDVRMKDRTWTGPRTGFEVLALFEGPAVAVGGEVVVARQAGPPTVVEAQGSEGAVLASTDLPGRAGDPVWGPTTLDDQRLQVSVRRAQPAAPPPAPSRAPAKASASAP